MATKFSGGKAGTKPCGKKPYTNAERKSRPWKAGDSGKKQNKLPFSKVGKGPQKRKRGEEGGEGERTFDRSQCSVDSLFPSKCCVTFLTSWCFHSLSLLVSLLLLDSQQAKCHTTKITIPTWLVSHSNDERSVTLKCQQ